MTLLAEYRERRDADAATLGAELNPDAFLFSRDVEGVSPLLPDSVSQRYSKQVARLGIATSIHKLRHYSATELIAAGVDVRTVAGRLGHSGGGTVTLKVYSAWVAESDQRAASSLFARLPQRPDGEQSEARELAPYETIAAELRAEIAVGSLALGAELPTNKALMARYIVSAGTAHRAVGLLATWGLVDVGRGRRAVVIGQPEVESPESTPTDTPHASQSRHGSQLWEIVVRGPDGRRYPARHVTADVDQPDQLRAHLLAIARLEAPDVTDRDESWVSTVRA